MQKQVPKAYLFLHNISKKNNIGTLIRSACAFGFTKIFFISNRPENSKKMKVMKQFHCFGNQGTFKQIQFQAFGSLQEAKKYFKQNDITVCGVQIGEGSRPVQEHPFKGNTAFFMGNEGSGIIPVHRQLCDHFVYIPQYTEKTASLNVGVAAGIIFHHFAVWAKFKEAKVYGEKFQLQENPIGQPKNKINQDEEQNEDQGQNIQQKQEQTAKRFEQLPNFEQSQNQKKI